MTQEKKGPSTVPCGTPESTVASSDSSPSITTFIFLFLRKFANQLLIEPLTPYSSSLLSNLLCGTVSKAFEKSRIATSVCMATSCGFRKSCNVANSLVSRE